MAIARRVLHRWPNFQTVCLSCHRRRCSRVNIILSETARANIYSHGIRLVSLLLNSLHHETLRVFVLLHTCREIVIISRWKLFHYRWLFEVFLKFERKINIHLFQNYLKKMEIKRFKIFFVYKVLTIFTSL